MEFQKGEVLYIYTSLGLFEITFNDFIDDEYIECTYGKKNKILKAKTSDVSRDSELARLYFYKNERNDLLEKIEINKRKLELSQNDLEKFYEKFKDLEMKFPAEFI